VAHRRVPTGRQVRPDLRCDGRDGGYRPRRPHAGGSRTRLLRPPRQHPSAPARLPRPGRQGEEGNRGCSGHRRPPERQVQRGTEEEDDGGHQLPLQ